LNGRRQDGGVGCPVSWHINRLPSRIEYRPRFTIKRARKIHDPWRTNHSRRRLSSAAGGAKFMIKRSSIHRLLATRRRTRGKGEARQAGSRLAMMAAALARIRPVLYLRALRKAGRFDLK
jgi:hypothetical protein